MFTQFLEKKGVLPEDNVSYIYILNDASINEYKLDNLDYVFVNTSTNFYKDFKQSRTSMINSIVETDDMFDMFDSSDDEDMSNASDEEDV
jgi:hypothetical protein